MFGGIFGGYSQAQTSSSSTTKSLTDAERQQLADLVKYQQQYGKENIDIQQQAIRDLVESYDEEAYEQSILDESLRQLANTQQQQQAATSSAAGSNYNTAAKAAADRAYAEAAIEANAKAQESVAAQNLAQYQAQAGAAANANVDLMNLYETLMGAWGQSSGKSTTRSMSVGAKVGAGQQGGGNAGQ